MRRKSDEFWLNDAWRAEEFVPSRRRLTRSRSATAGAGSAPGWRENFYEPHDNKHDNKTVGRFLRIEFGIPIKIIQPAVVQIVRREQPAVAMQLMHRGCERQLPRKHPSLLRRQVS